MFPDVGISSRVVTFILAGGRGERLYPLTEDRAKPLIPFGGACRLIDFTLSNCFNSGLRRITVLTQYLCESLHSYVQALSPQTPIEQDRDEFLHCLCPAEGKRYGGTADAVVQNLSLIAKTKPEFVLILSSDHVYRMDYRDLLRFHLDRRADMTISAVEYPRNAASQFGVLETNSEGDAVTFEEKPGNPKAILGNPSKSLVNMGVYVFNTGALMDALCADAQRTTNYRDFGKNVIPDLIQRQRVSVYNFTSKGTRLGSYWRDVGTVDAYYCASMESLMNSFFELYATAEWPLYSLDMNGRTGWRRTRRRLAASVQNAAISPGVSLGRGTRVTDSLLSTGVQIGRSARVCNSILLNNVRVGAGARIRRAILDDNVQIGAGVEVGSDLNTDRKYGFVTDNGIVVIPANTYVGSSSPTAAPPQVKWRTELVKNDRPKTLRSEAGNPGNPTESREIDKD
jgi:glucose-1-phosphate adenylyltransferase